MSDDHSQHSSDDDGDYHTCDEDDEDESRVHGAPALSSSSSDDGRDWLDYHHTSDDDDEEDEKMGVAGATPVVAVKKETSQLQTSSDTGLEEMLPNFPCDQLERNTQLVSRTGPIQNVAASTLPTGNSSMEGNTRTLNQYFYLTKQQFGDVTVQKADQLNLSVGGEQTINRNASNSQEEKKDSTPSRADIINKKTVSKIQTWNQGLVKTAALDRVLGKLEERTTWLTIKGNPGEGKTTVGYMALEELHQRGRKVFEVTSPADFTEIVENCSRPVIMLDDVFGNLEFDQIKWSTWERVISPLLKEREHTSHVMKDGHVTVILTGRDYVLNLASVGLGRLSDFLRSDKHVVSMDNSVERDINEKRAIWETLSRSRDVELDKMTVDEIIRIKVPHGFPHVCRLFTTIYKENKTVSAVEFFSKPLEFLNESISKLFEDTHKVSLFKEMIKGEGKISEKELRREDKEYKMTKAANSLEGTYIKVEDDSFVFDHPSIYDSVAFHLCSLDPEFVIKKCQLSFIHERVRLSLSKDGKTADSPGSSLVAYINKAFADDLAERFASEIMAQNLVQVLSHQAFTNASFVNKVMSKIRIPLDLLLRLQGRGYHLYDTTFLSLVPSSKSPELLKYIDNCPHIALSEDDIATLLHGICRCAASKVLTYMISTRKSLDIDRRFEIGRNKTVLMVAAATRDDQFVQQILSLNPDLNAMDTAKKTVLHYLCENGLVSAVTRMIDSGADINVKDMFEMSPLCVACESNQLEVVKLLIERGATVHELSLYCACFSGNIEIVKLLFKKKPTFNDNVILNKSLPGAIQGDSVDIMRLFFHKGVSVNTTDSHLFPLHAACVYNRPKALQFLLQQGATIDHLDKDGDTALHCAVSWGHKECLDVLLKAGAKLDLQNNNGETALHTAIWRHFEDCVYLLVRNSANVNARNKKGNTPLHLLTRIGSGEYLKMLLSDQIRAITYDKHGKGTPYKRIEIQKKECVDLLLEAGAEVNISNRDGNTPLHNAFNQSYPIVPDKAVCQMLIQKGADVNALNKDGDAPLHLLYRSQMGVKMDHPGLENWDIVRYRQLVTDHYRQLVELLMDNGADVDIQNNLGKKASEEQDSLF